MLALVLEAIREPGQLRRVLARAAARDIPVVLLTAGRSASGRAMVAAHSGALAAGDGGWEALARAYGVHRVGDLAELADTLELFAIGRRVACPARRRPRPAGIATVHDSGLERAHAADLAEDVGVPFAAIGETTRARLAEILDPGLTPGQPARRVGHRRRHPRPVRQLADHPGRATRRWPRSRSPSTWSASSTGTSPTRWPCWTRRRRPPSRWSCWATWPAPSTRTSAAQLRQHGIPVLEGLRTGLLALRHLLDHADRSAPSPGMPPRHCPARLRHAPPARLPGTPAGAAAPAARAPPAPP